MDLKKQLQAVKKEILSLNKKIENLIVAVDKTEKKKTPKTSPTVKATRKKPATGKSDALTAVETVFRIIKRSKKGVTTATLMEKTGFNDKKIFNNIYKLKKQGKIVSKAKGVYIKV